MKLQILILSLASTIFACGSDEPRFRNVRDAVIELVDALCSRANECGASGTISSCVDDVTAALCKDIAEKNGSCAAGWSGDYSAFDDCIAAVDTSDCSSDNLPAQCQGVIVPSSVLAHPSSP